MSFYKQLTTQTEPDRKELLNVPLLRRAAQGDISKDAYLAFLAQAYHHVKHTVPLLMACGSRLPEHLHWLRRAIGEYIEEEMGHEEWILDDIAACGGDAAAVYGAVPSPATELMVAYAYDLIARRNPVGFFGMVFVLEGTSVQLASQAAEAVKNKLNLPVNAFRYLNSHGALDQNHIKFFEILMDRIENSADQQSVVHCARMFYLLYGNIFRGISASLQ
ncbi:MAG: iron-containing redox enzyme family protein [Gammaproteobacteria bacterium]|jgi:thiaminase